MTRRSLPGAAALLLVMLAAVSACRKAPAAMALVAPRESGPGAGTGSSPPPAGVEGSDYAFTPAESLAVREFLRSHPELRVASDADRRPSEEDDVRSLYGIYHAYFVRGDLNDDGILDFVLAFVRRDSSRETPWFSIVVFAGKERGGSGPAFGPGTFLEKDISLDRGDVSIDRDAVLISPDLSDESVRRYRWDPLRRSYVFVRDDGDEDPTPPLART